MPLTRFGRQGIPVQPIALAAVSIGVWAVKIAQRSRFKEGERMRISLAVAVIFLAGINLAGADDPPGQTKASASGAALHPVAAGQQPPTWHEPAAEVNGEVITRAQLAEALISYFGPREIEQLIKNKIIEQELTRRHLQVANEELEQELEHRLAELRLEREDFEQRLLKSQGMTIPQYLRTTVWRQLALRKIAAAGIIVSEEEIAQGFAARFGEKVELRLFQTDEFKKAQEYWNQFAKIKDVNDRQVAFEATCKRESTDEATKPFAGRCAPVARFSDYPTIEKEAFSLKNGELSKVLPMPEGYVILMRIQMLPAQTDVQLTTIVDPQKSPKETVRDVLVKQLREKKLTAEVEKLTQKFRQASVVVNYLDQPGVKTSADRRATGNRQLRLGN